MAAAKTFYILDHFFLPTPRNHGFFVTKFSQGFQYHGYLVKRVKTLAEIQEPGFVMISNHSFYQGLVGRRYDWLERLLVRLTSTFWGRPIDRFAARQKFRVIDQLGRRIRGRKIILLAWFWHEHDSFFLDRQLPVIFTGEYFFGEPSPSHKSWYNYYLSRPNARPIKFAADIDPEKIGLNLPNKDIAVSFIGNKSYKPEWLATLCATPHCRLVPTPPYIPEADRIDIYRRSRISLGLHSVENIANRVVVERVFEAIAYGAICLTDNPAASGATDGQAIFVPDLAALQDKIKYFSSNPAALAEQRVGGLLWARANGTYAHEAKGFIALSKQLFPKNIYEEISTENNRS